VGVSGVKADLSVIIPSRNLSNLLPCIRALRNFEPDLRIIWVDDRDDEFPRGNREEEAEVEAVAQHSLLVVKGAKPFIFARNVNLGIRAAGNDDVVVLNDDALLHGPAGPLRLMQREASFHPDFGVIGAVTNVTGQPLQWPQGVGLRAVPHLAFVCVLVPRATIDRVGLLDERYCLDYGVEDRDYCEACRRAGLGAAVYDWCYVNHSSLSSTFRGDPMAPKDFSRNKALFDAKWGAGVWEATA
jgi:GT2 family glycosyltransferase